MNKLLLQGFSAVLLCSALACGGSEQKPPEQAPAAQGGVQEDAGPPVPGDWLVAAFPTEPEILNFVIGSDIYVSEIGRYVADGLFDYDKDLNVIPRLAKEWSWTHDHLQLTVKIHENVKWHDGVPFTADDIKYTIDKIKDPKSRSDNKIASFEKVKKVEVLDPYTIRLYYTEPYAPALAALADNIYFIAKHIYENENWFESPYNFKPMGTGPYKFVEWDRGNRIILERNPDYWGEKKPYLDRIVYLIRQEETVRFQSLLSGEVDYATMKPVQWVKEAATPAFEARFHKHLYYVQSFNYVGWNMDGSNSFFLDKKVRQAMALAFDRKGVSDTIFYGLYKVAACSQHPSSWALNPKIQPWPYDPEKAKALLEEAGWSDRNGDGVRENASGKPFRFTALIPAQIEITNQIAQVMREQFRKVGLEMDIQPLEWAVFLQRVKEGKFEAEIAAWSLGLDPVDEYDLWHSSQWPDGINYGKYANKEVDKLLSDARYEFDQEKRKLMYWRSQELIHEDQPYMFLYYPPTLLAIDKRFQGIKISPYGIARFNPGYLDWWVPQGKHRY
jgi:peptide/nickel transport system substrate-binding protein